MHREVSFRRKTAEKTPTCFVSSFSSSASPDQVRSASTVGSLAGANHAKRTKRGLSRRSVACAKAAEIADRASLVRSSWPPRVHQYLACDRGTRRAQQR